MHCLSDRLDIIPASIVLVEYTQRGSSDVDIQADAIALKRTTGKNIQCKHVKFVWCLHDVGEKIVTV